MFCERFKHLKQIHNLTFEKLAEDTKISLRSLKYYSSGAKEPSMSTLIALADYFNVSLDYLVGRSDTDTRPDPHSDSKD